MEELIKASEVRVPYSSLELTDREKEKVIRALNAVISYQHKQNRRIYIVQLETKEIAYAKHNLTTAGYFIIEVKNGKDYTTPSEIIFTPFKDEK